MSRIIFQGWIFFWTHLLKHQLWYFPPFRSSTFPIRETWVQDYPEVSFFIAQDWWFSWHSRAWPCRNGFYSLLFPWPLISYLYPITWFWLVESWSLSSGLSSIPVPVQVSGCLESASFVIICIRIQAHAFFFMISGTSIPCHNIFTKGFLRSFFIIWWPQYVFHRHWYPINMKQAFLHTSSAEWGSFDWAPWPLTLYYQWYYQDTIFQLTFYPNFPLIFLKGLQ